MLVGVLIFCAVDVLIIAACCKVSGNCSRLEEERELQHKLKTKVKH